MLTDNAYRKTRHDHSMGHAPRLLHAELQDAQPCAEGLGIAVRSYLSGVWIRSIGALVAAFAATSPVAVCGDEYYDTFGKIVPFQLEENYEIEAQDYIDWKQFDRNKIELGRLLFFDKILSGNKDIACATCHHPTLATADGLSLSVGTGGSGLGPGRDMEHDAGGGVVRRMPRHAVALFGVGHRDHSLAFVDGRVAKAPDGYFSTPAGRDLPPGLEHLVAAAAMFPVQPHEEMSGEPGDNPIADAAAGPDFPKLWKLLSARVTSIPFYAERMSEIYGIKSADISFAHIANALAAFIIDYGRITATSFESYIQGDPGALSGDAKRGAEIFFGRGRCVECHKGPLFSDMDFHAIAMPQVGPGKGDGWLGREDFGREQVTGDPADRYKFRTPILLNVGHTEPYGHAGQFKTLEAVIRHHAAPGRSIRDYECGLTMTGGQLIMPSRPDLDKIDCAVHHRPGLRHAIVEANDLRGPRLSERDIRYLVQFLEEGLTDQIALDYARSRTPDEVPSGLPVD